MSGLPAADSRRVVRGMSKLSRYDRSRDVRRGNYRETQIDHAHQAAYTDRQWEIARKFYPDGRLEAERLRTRNRTHYVPAGGHDVGGIWHLFKVHLAVAALYLIVATVGYGLAGESWWGLVGAVVGVALFLSLIRA